MVVEDACEVVGVMEVEVVVGVGVVGVSVGVEVGVCGLGVVEARGPEDCLVNLVVKGAEEVVTA